MLYATCLHTHVGLTPGLELLSPCCTGVVETDGIHLAQCSLCARKMAPSMAESPTNAEELSAILYDNGCVMPDKCADQMFSALNTIAARAWA